MPRAVVKDYKASLYAGQLSSPTGSVDVSVSDASLLVWVKIFRPNGGTVGGFYTSTNDSLRFTVESSGKLFVWSVNGAGGGNLCCKTNTSVPTQQWIRVAVTYAVATNAVNLYVNGALMISGTANTPRSSNILTLNASTSQHLLGASATYSRVLTATELAVDYAGTLPASPTEIYKTSEGAGSTAFDSSGNVHNAAIISPTWVSDTPTKKRQVVNGNMVSNGDFEYSPPFTAVTTGASKYIDGSAAGSTTNDLFSWASRGGTGSIAASFDISQKNSGVASLKLSVTATGSACQASQVLSTTISATDLSKPRLITVQPFTSYTLTFWMKTNYISGSSADGAYIEYQERSAGGSTVSNNATTKVQTTTDWTQYAATITTASNTHFMEVVPSVIGNTGTATLIMDAWFDDITLTPTTPVPRLAAQDMKASLNCDGTGTTYVSVPRTTVPDFVLAGTLSYWIKPRSFAAESQVMEKGTLGTATNNSWKTSYLATGYLRLTNVNVADITDTGAYPLQRGIWQHVAITKNGTLYSFYVNGRLSGTVTSATSITSNSDPLIIGRRAINTTNAANALIKSAKFWTTDIGAAAIANLAAIGYGAASPSLNLQLDEGAGTTAMDTSGNANNGTISGATYSADTPTKKRALIDGNLVPNGDFEYAPPFTALTTAGVYIDGTTLGSSTNSLFGAWANVSGSGPGSAGTMFDTSTSHSGNASLKLSLLTTSNSLVVAQGIGTGTPSSPSDMMVLLPNTSYTLSVWIKTNNAAVNAVWVDLRQYSGSFTALTTTNTAKVSGTTGWTQYTMTVTTSATCYWGRIFLRNNVVGNVSDVWFDDIVLLPTTPITRTLVT